ncbi:MFS transporter [Glutamicibacter sp. MNS18]|uniref:MFS transporter n=1 Tax=Glutamicibacter sp. MNS18 TaxID=2989817 RepID=UPI002236107E|nr:MFS transporter [Glutamicibacter sp. MNS18]MCW4466463.1 MFS transporter [Glutamicibacter sp. MNS18]
MEASEAQQLRSDLPVMSYHETLRSIAGVLASFFAAMLAATIVSIALPTMMDSLGGSQTDFNWVLTSALLANAATTPIWGKMADLFDKKKLLQAGILVFVGGSLLAGFSTSIPMLLGARVIQGVGMGGLTAMGMAVIGTVIAPRERGKYSGYFGSVMAVATAAGPLLGGLIVDSPLGWRWTFFLGIPISLLSMVLIHKTLHIVHIKRPVYIDWGGAVLLTSAVSLLLIWVSYVGKPEFFAWHSWQTYSMVGGALLLTAILLWVESIVPDPIVPLRIIATRTTSLAIIASIAIGVGMFGTGAFIGQYFQIAREASPTMAGLMTLPLIAGNFAGSVFSGQMITRFGRWKIYLVLGSLFNVAGLLLLSFMQHDTEYWLLGVGMFLNGLGMGFMLQNLVLSVQNTVKVTDIGSASSAVAFFRSVGGSAGVAVLGAMLSNRVSDLVNTGVSKLGAEFMVGVDAGDSLNLSAMPAPVRLVVEAAYGEATGIVFLVSAIVAAVAVVCVALIREVPLRRTI